MEASDCVHGGYHKATVGGEHFIVEDLLDFSNEETEGDNAVNGGDDGGFEEEAATSAESCTVTAVDSCNSSFSGVADASFSGEICEPLQYDELAELEWLSNFVEESFSSEDLHLISGPEPGSGPNSSSSTTRNSEVPSFYAANLTASVPGKARSKRSRAAPCNWTSSLLVLDPKPAKRQGIKIAPMTAAAAVADSNGRKCLHCATDKTPQWRAGPMGPKTLCNACGVRYKSGRLVPEYRPAASPTFVMSKHSNSHRKVMEMRKKKEMQQQLVEPAPAAAEEEEEVLIGEHLGADYRQLI